MPSTSTRIITAFLHGKSARARNDRTDGTKLFFWASPIAEHLGNKQILLSHCGHSTPSTIRRLNTICELVGLGRPWRVHNYTVLFQNEPVHAPVTIIAKHSPL